MIQKIVAGIPRSGKSLACKEAAKESGILYIPFDSIVSTMHDLYPDLKISHYLESQDVSKRVAPFLKSFIKHLKYEKIDFIIDVYQLYPVDVIQNKIDADFIFLGYPSANIDEKLSQIRKYASPGDWSENLSDTQMKAIIEKYINECQILRDQCDEYGFPFVDMSHDFDKSLQKAIKLIKR